MISTYYFKMQGEKVNFFILIWLVFLMNFYKLWTLSFEDTHVCSAVFQYNMMGMKFSVYQKVCRSSS
jgi:hypothetical protein